MKTKLGNLYIYIRNYCRLEKNKLRYFKEINIYDSDNIKSKDTTYSNRIITKVEFEVKKNNSFKDSFNYKKEIVNINFIDGKYEHNSNYFDISKDEIKNIYNDILETIYSKCFLLEYDCKNSYDFIECSKENLKSVNVKEYLNFSNITACFKILN